VPPRSRANFDGKACERAALAVNWPTYLAPDKGIIRSCRNECAACSHTYALLGMITQGTVKFNLCSRVGFRESPIVFRTWTIRRTMAVEAGHLSVRLDQSPSR